MIEYIKYEVWENYWCFKPSNELDLSILKRLDYYSYFRESEILLEIQIESPDSATEPEIEQIETLKFIIDNQIEISNSIFDYYQKVILPVYKVATDIEEDEIANKPSELNKVFGIKGIEIPTLNNALLKYYLIKFDFKYDNEHGLYILFRDTTPIDFFGEGDKDYSALDFYIEKLENRDNELLIFNLYQLNGETILRESYHYDEQIRFPLKKGTYRAFITFNKSQRCSNFYVPNDLESFTIRQIMTKN
jgi:hypothetical protein